MGIHFPVTLALPFMGFKPLNSNKVYLAESKHYIIVHNIRMTELVALTSGLGFFFFFLRAGVHPPSR